MSDDNLKCDLDCKRCARILETVNKICSTIIGIPFTDKHCPLEIFDEMRKAKYLEEAIRLETKIYLKEIKKAIGENE
jgi:hypothetical protein